MQQLERLRRWWDGPLPPGRSTPLELVMIQGTRFCNIDCDYCYLPFRSDKSRFDLDLVAPLFGGLIEAGLLGEQVSVLWHAGEPLVLKPEWYVDAFARVAAAVGEAARVEHHFQTNGMLINDDWCRLIKAHDVRVGVSLDGPAFLHDQRRKTRTGGGTHARAMAGIDKLREHGIGVSVICVLSAESLRHPDAIYDFFAAHDLWNVGFNVEEVEGHNTASTLSAGDQVQAYRAFLKRVLDRARADGFRMQLRELGQAPQILGSMLSGMAPFTGEAVPFSILSVDVEGRLHTWSPELVDIKDRQGRDFVIGHVRDLDFAKIAQGERFRQIDAEIRQGVDLCRQTCAYFDLCGGGVPVNKLSENGSFASTETLHCRLTRKAVADVIEQEVLEAVARRRARVARTEARPGAPRRPAAPTLDRLTPGVPLLNAHAIRDRIRLSAGTGAPDEAGYAATSRVPRGPWRAPIADEIGALTARPPGNGPFSFISLLQLHEPAVRRLCEKAAKLQADTPWAEAVAVLGPEACTEVVEVLAKRAVVPASVGTLGASINPTGRQTVTRDADGTWLGLHVDSWFDFASDKRAEAPNRICLNLGRSPRKFLFVNLDIKRVAALLEAAGEPFDRGRNPSQIAQSFMRRYPSYPAISLEVRPGEAYIAPTEAIIHDGCTLDQDGPDITLTLLGLFPPPPTAQPAAALAV